jgi:hypothetical protein
MEPGKEELQGGKQRKEVIEPGDEELQGG